MEQRTINFNAAVNRELDRCQERRDARKREQVSPVSEQAQKKYKTAASSVQEANLSTDSIREANDSTARTKTTGTIATAGTATGSNREIFAASCVTDQVHDEKISMTDLDAGIVLHPPTSSVGGQFSFGNASIGTTTTVDWTLGDWAFADTIADPEPTEYSLGQWAFANADMATHNDIVLGDWAFSHVDSITTSDNNWILASTVANGCANDEPEPPDAVSEVSLIATSTDSVRAKTK